jgi:hypothetical protein
MTTIENVNSNGVLTRKEREELVLDLYFKENKTYSEIAKIARMPNHCICNRNPIGVIYDHLFLYCR